MDGKDLREVRRRTAMTKMTIRKLTPLLRSHTITTSAKISLFQSLRSNILLYGSKSWGIGIQEEKEIEAIRTIFIRSMLGGCPGETVSATKNVTGELVTIYLRNGSLTSCQKKSSVALDRLAEWVTIEKSNNFSNPAVE